jgi:alkylation response protein AidB-like acyl-CoA dehydrogenase
VELRNCPSFAAMEGTNTFAVRMTDHFIGADQIVADPVRPFIGRIRGAFILLQCGMGLGVAQGAIDSMWQVERQLGHVNEFLEDRPDELQAELDTLTERTLALARTPYATDKEFLIDVLDVRAHASELALRAAQSALLHQGARGYLMSSAVQRRVRESHFVAIVTPAIKHLRKEMARLSAEVTPA